MQYSFQIFKPLKILSMRKIIFQFLILAFTCKFGFAQQPTTDSSYSVQEKKAEITLSDGNILRGTIIKINERIVVFKSDMTGEITIDRNKIVNIKYYDNKNKGSQQTYINLASRYFFGPSAINMKKGDGYYQNTYLFLHTFNYAFTDNFTLGGGTEIISLLFGKPIIMITPKISMPIKDDLHIGGGYLFLWNSSMGETLNLAYGNITFGSNDLNASLNIGTNVAYPGNPLIVFSGFARLGTKFGIMTENWMIPTNNTEYYNIYSFGGRIIGRKNFFDFALITNADIMKEILGIPFLTYTLRF